ncbi:hypothetical protein P4S93_17900 [Aneurinibacillus thermoaerophilus]|uniref:Uncharacterized protein n=1 Tax=Aneurinibacillus thermoaerophilus TaxID=143495 RepID=A0A1G8FHW6_ANETH|nr:MULTISPECIES: hypothetical protein [Aneurinibacillus]AMA71540.1 hypothetical protein ACH33_00955 [Aneurinibacillus sp. XH2]MED0759099.1 hypothetical protein [Aneurinibacillus thermoaerophilus]MED0762595.1 hypothetical protein [Aneurinibacillus thermoaerophilus]SDH81682.1 hypothetical protein SAMN04489735_10683 [Aneurinibacillus thermoaerophilus]
MPDLKTAQQIAQSQYVFSILFIFLFFSVIGASVWLFNNLRKENEEREKKIMEMHEKREKELLQTNLEYKLESKEREQKLMEHLERTTEAQKEMSQTMEKVQQGLSTLETNIKDVWMEIKHLKKVN